MKYRGDYTGWPGQAWDRGSVGLMFTLSCPETFMALAAPPSDLVWSSCGHSHIMSYTPTSKVLLFFSITSTSLKKKKMRQGYSWCSQNALGVESSSSSLVGCVSKLSRTEYWFMDAGSSWNLPRKDQKGWVEASFLYLLWLLPFRGVFAHWYIQHRRVTSLQHSLFSDA